MDIISHSSSLHKDSHKLCITLNQLRNNIDNIDIDKWLYARWYVNKYDFTIIKPIINRAFYKFIEIIHDYNIYDNLSNITSNYILHCAEAPGGFIQATNYWLKHNFIHRNTHIYTISKKNITGPIYNKSIIKSNVTVTYGYDNTGDICNWNNIEYILQRYKQRFYVITCDGGFDDNHNYNNKEISHYNLILSEIYTAIYLQKSQGHFVLKIFDIFTYNTLNLLYILKLCYTSIHIVKPKTSRPTNSEKYVICKNFHINEKRRYEILQMLYKIKNYFHTNTNFTFVYQNSQQQLHYHNTLLTMCRINKKLVHTQIQYIRKSILLCMSQNTVSHTDIQKDKNLYQKQWMSQYNLIISKSI